MINKPFFKIKVLGIAIMACLFVTSCSDDDSNENSSFDITQQDVMKSLEVEKISNFIDGMTLDNIAMNRSNAEVSSNFGKADCADFSVTDTGYTLTFTDCTTDDGETISGKINVNVVIDNNSVSTTITFENLTFAGNSINGSKSTSYSLNTVDGGSFIYTVTSDLSITLADGTTASEMGTKTYRVTELGTAEASYTISGDWTVTIGSDTYSLRTDPSLQGTFSCDYITTGTLILAKNALTASINYGDGTCDNKATVTYPDGTNEEIDL
ncbi:hypothetical protein [Aquimarina sp. 2201CG14-23]|uniref:hypothetical protein n=1 Tax=Aquimarina mycalae TaxID=3040073 RepID=UPI0024780BAA|nr:hypothetical protein [Aquimarina sp. 2201CG14-23]MDH7446501.1 hypothetical protein [Aquimarina sp. 2201CG14-23]